MSLFCECDGTLQNTGVPGKQAVVQNAVKLIAVRMYADDGTRNQIDESDVINQAYVDALLQNADASKRWFPIGDFTNVTDERADPATESSSDGSNSVVQQGVRAFQGWLRSYSPKYIENLDSFKCNSFGVYGIDACGNLIGSISKDGTKLRPIRVNNSSWYARYVKASDTAVAKIQLNFEFSQLEQDKSLRIINENDMTAELLEVEGLKDMAGSVSGISTTGFVIALTLPWGQLSKEDVVGLVAADFSLYNTTTASSIVITTVTEAPDGTYTFVIPAQTSADVLRLRTDPTNGSGFWIEELITIP